MKQFGIQLYTVRDHMQNEADFAETMKKLAAMGVVGFISVFVGKNNKISVPFCIAAENHRAVRSRINGGAVFCG